MAYAEVLSLFMMTWVKFKFLQERLCQAQKEHVLFFPADYIIIHNMYCMYCEITQISILITNNKLIKVGIRLNLKITNHIN